MLTYQAQISEWGKSRGMRLRKSSVRPEGSTHLADRALLIWFRPYFPAILRPLPALPEPFFCLPAQRAPLRNKATFPRKTDSCEIEEVTKGLWPPSARTWEPLLWARTHLFSCTPASSSLCSHYVKTFHVIWRCRRTYGMSTTCVSETSCLWALLRVGWMERSFCSGQSHGWCRSRIQVRQKPRKLISPRNWFGWALPIRAVFWDICYLTFLDFDVLKWKIAVMTPTC